MTGLPDPGMVGGPQSLAPAVAIGGATVWGNDSMGLGYGVRVGVDVVSGATPTNAQFVTGATAIGARASVGAHGGVAIGADSAVWQDYDVFGPAVDGTAIGRGAQAAGPSSTALGAGAWASASAVAIGANSRAASPYSVGIGADTSEDIYGGNRGSHNVMIGAGAKVDGYSAGGAVTRAVALGAGSVAVENDTVSLGVAGGLTRRIVNVTTPRDATDAATKGYVDSAVSFGAGGAAYVAAGVVAGTIDAGVQNSVAIGSGSVAAASNVFSVGFVGGERRIVNVAAGLGATDAVNKGQLDVVATAAAAAQATADAANSRALVPGPAGATGPAGADGASGATGSTGAAGATGVAAAPSNMLSRAAGQVSVIAHGDVAPSVRVTATGALSMSTGVAAGAQASMTLTNALGNTHGIVIEEAQTVLSGGAHSTTMTLTDSGARLSNAQSGAAVILSGVAGGVAPTDAANVGQMRGEITAAITPLDSRLTNVEGAVARLDQRVTEVEAKLSAGIAMASALAQPVSFAPGKPSVLTGGVATYNGQSAVGFSVSRLAADTPVYRLIVSGGVGLTTGGQTTVRAGVSINW